MLASYYAYYPKCIWTIVADKMYRDGQDKAQGELYMLVFGGREEPPREIFWRQFFCSYSSHPLRLIIHCALLVLRHSSAADGDSLHMETNVYQRSVESMPVQILRYIDINCMPVVLAMLRFSDDGVLAFFRS